MNEFSDTTELASEKRRQLEYLPDDENRVHLHASPVQSEKRQAIHELFERQAARAPDAVALSFEAERLTFAQLNRRANRIGHYLLSQGAGPEVVVGICMERSVEMVVAILAVLK